MEKKKRYSIQYFLIFLIMLGAMLCIFTPNHYYFKSFSIYAVQIMFGYLFLGVLFLVAKRPRLTFASFVACGAIALFLKVSTNSDLKTPDVTVDEAMIKVAHINISNINDDPESSIQSIRNSDACLISIPNLDPIVYEILKEELKEDFPYSTDLIGFEHAIAVFSKYTIESQDTFFTDGLPSILGKIKTEGTGREWYFVTSNTLPPFYQKDYQRLQNQLLKIANRSKEIDYPIITIADYNLVPWQDELQDFRDKINLKDSRRGFSPASTTNVLSAFFAPPHEHIFHTDHFKCINFSNLTSSTNHLGITSTFQFNPLTTDDKGTN